MNKQQKRIAKRIPRKTKKEKINSSEHGGPEDTSQMKSNVKKDNSNNNDNSTTNADADKLPDHLIPVSDDEKKEVSEAKHSQSKEETILTDEMKQFIYDFADDIRIDKQIIGTPNTKQIEFRVNDYINDVIKDNGAEFGWKIANSLGLVCNRYGAEYAITKADDSNTPIFHLISVKKRKNSVLDDPTRKLRSPNPRKQRTNSNTNNNNTLDAANAGVLTKPPMGEEDIKKLKAKSKEARKNTSKALEESKEQQLEHMKESLRTRSSSKSKSEQSELNDNKHTESELKSIKELKDPVPKHNNVRIKAENKIKKRPVSNTTRMTTRSMSRANSAEERNVSIPKHRKKAGIPPEFESDIISFSTAMLELTNEPKMLDKLRKLEGKVGDGGTRDTFKTLLLNSIPFETLSKHYKTFVTWFNRKFSDTLGWKLSYDKLKKKGDKITGIGFKKFKTTVLDPKSAEELLNEMRIKNDKKRAITKFSKDTYKASVPKVANSDKFFTYDINEVYRIIESSLNITLSKQAKVSIDMILYRATKNLRDDKYHYADNGSSKYEIEQAISSVEQYINGLSKSGEKFVFSSSEHDQLYEILKKESKSAHGKMNDRILDRINALKNFV